VAELAPPAPEPPADEDELPPFPPLVCGPLPPDPDELVVLLQPTAINTAEINVRVFTGVSFHQEVEYSRVAQ
jgi:hypothetical protein